jgi:bacterial/archaeal transporter family-2 protein
MIYLLFLLAFIVGALLPWQPVINAKLGVELQSPLWSAFISFLGGAILLGIAVFFQGNFIEKTQKLSTLPWWLMTGGVLGITFVSASIFLIPKIGATSLTAAFICGQLLMSLIMDHYALAGLTERTLDWSRIVGTILLLTGLFFILRSTHES